MNTVPHCVVVQESQDKRALVRAINSGHLLQGRQEIVIRHDGQEYRLRVTRQNKLILTK